MILAGPTERVVTRFVLSSTGYRARHVSCPSGVPAKPGGTFQCHFTGPDGRYTAYMTIRSVKGTRVDYRIQTLHVGNTIRARIAEQTVAAFVAERTGFHPQDVACPPGVVPLLGHTVTCHFTGPDGSYTATLVITSSSRGKIGYRIETRRTG